MAFYRTWHNEILILTRLDITAVDYLVSRHKHTIGVNAAHYDWKMNSAGQDNVGKVLLAILSFKRLKEKYPNNYAGGILVIDELDATLYPASQIKLVDALVSFSAKYNIQIIFTTHSLTILEHTCKLQNNLKRSGQVQVIYLQQKDLNVKVIPNISFEEIKNHLTVRV
jgi:AAA15 family ATPase/GTPase